MMMVLDQLILARYSIEAMTGAASASVWCSALQCSTMSVIMICSAIVGNYNGAQKYHMAGMPVWQMIWFAIALFLISIPVSIFGGRYCIPPGLYEFGLPYFQVCSLFIPICGISCALSGFFIAIGRGMLVTVSIIIANIVNVIIDIILIFGFFGIEDFKGSVGAAIGTVCSWFIHCTLLLLFFFQKSFRAKYHTLNFRLRLQKLKEYLKLGGFGGIGHVCEIFAWGTIYYTLASINTKIAMIQSIAVSVNVFMAFIVSGLEKGIMAMSANLLGAGMKDKTKILIKNGISIHLMFFIFVATVFIFFPDVITSNFIKFQVEDEIINDTVFILRLVLVYFLVDGVCWVIAGVLEAGGDLGFTMFTIATCIWSIVTIPAIILARHNMLNIKLTWCLLIISVCIMSSVLYRRYKSEKWIHISV
jgi:Na+-driven multidrug efflux pump